MMKSLDDIADIVVGYQAKTHIHKSPEGLFRLIQGKDFYDSQYLKEENLLWFVPERNPVPYLICKDDVLFQARGTNHFAYYLEEEIANALASSSFYIIRLKTKKIMPEYLAWWLNQKIAQTYFNTHASTTAISFISKKILSQLELIIPPLSVQEKICQVIKLWKQETNLRKELSKKRLKLINEFCLNAAQ